MKLFRFTALTACFAVSLASAAVLTNADVTKMAQAKLDPNIIITAVENAEPNFDVSAQGLIDLSAANVPQPVISAMIRRAHAATSAPAANATATAAAGTASTPAAATSAAAPASGTDARALSPSEVTFIDGDKSAPMKYLNPQMRTAARGLGFGGVASYAVLRGVTASLHTSNGRPSFLVSVPNQAQPESYFTLASFAVRKNGSREVMVGGGFMSYSTGIHPDRIVPTTSEKVADQSKAEKGFTLYRVTPTQKMAPGQYAVILYTGELQGLVGAWFTGAGNAYFDFAIDGGGA